MVENYESYKNSSFNLKPFNIAYGVLRFVNHKKSLVQQIDKDSIYWCYKTVFSQLFTFTFID